MTHRLSSGHAPTRLVSLPTVTHSAPPPAGTDLTTRNRVGLALAGVLGLSDVVTLFAYLPDGATDPVAVVEAVLGVITVMAVAFAWFRRSRRGLRVAVVTRLLSLVPALPAFFYEGVPAHIVALVTVSLLVTLVAVALLLSRR